MSGWGLSRAWRTLLLNIDLERSFYWAIASVAITLAWTEAVAFIVHRRKLGQLARETPRNVLVSLGYACTGDVAASIEYESIPGLERMARMEVQRAFGGAKRCNSFHRASASFTGEPMDVVESLAQEALMKARCGDDDQSQRGICIGFGILDVRDQEQRQVFVVCICESMGSVQRGVAVAAAVGSKLAREDLGRAMAQAVSQMIL